MAALIGWRQVRNSEGVRATFWLSLLLAIVFFPALFGGRTLLMSAWDAPSVMVSGAYSPDPQPVHFSRTVDPGAPAWQSEAWYRLIADEYWAKGELPLWNPYSAYGMPFAAAMLPQPFYPLSALLSVHPTAATYNLMVVLRLLAAGLLTFFFARLFVPFLAALFAGAAFMLTGYFILFMTMPHLSVEVLLPGLFLFAEVLLRRNTWPPVVGLAVMLYLSIVGGMPESLFLSVSFAGFYFLFRLFSVPEFRAGMVGRLLRGGAALILGFGLGAIVLVPFAEFVPLSHNVHTPGNLGGRQVGLDYFNDPRAIITHLLPLFFGPVGNDILTGFSGWTGMHGYCGVIAAIFALAAFLGAVFRRWSGFRQDLRAVTLFFAIALALMVMKRFGSPLVNWVGSLPVADHVIYTKYIEPLVGFAIAMLAGIGFAHLGQMRRAVFLVATAIVTLTIAGFTIWALPQVLAVERYAWFFYFAVGFAAVLVAISLRGFLISPQNRWARATPWAFIALLAADLLANNILPGHYVANRTPPLSLTPYAGAPYIDFLKARNTDRSRIFAREGALYPDWGAAFGFFDVRDLEAIYYRRYMDFIRAFLLRPGDEARVTGDLADRFTGAERGYRYAFQTEVQRRFLQLSSVRYLVSPTDLTRGEVEEEVFRQHESENIWGFGPTIFAVDGHLRQSLFQHPPSPRISFSVHIDPDRAALTGVAVVNPEASGKSDGVGFTIEVESEGRIEKLYSDLVAAADIRPDSEGKPFRIDLSRFAGKDVRLLFSTDPGPAGQNAYDWASWLDLAFVPTGEAAPVARFASIYDREVQIYEIPAVLPRAALFGAVEVLPEAAILARLKDPAFDPARAVLVSAESADGVDLARLQSPAVAVAANIVSYRPQEVIVDTETAAPALLMLNDANYPGWIATIDGRPARLLDADYLFRGVLVPAGRSRVTFAYAPASYRYGAMITAASAILLVVPAFFRRRRKPSAPVSA